MQDLRYGTRVLRRNPLFTLTAALSLAIGIGANTTVFDRPRRAADRHHADGPSPGHVTGLRRLCGRHADDRRKREARGAGVVRCRPAGSDHIAAAAVLFSAIGLVASYLPACRAMRIQTIDALRHD